jgi:hypothetical protein
VPRWVNAPQAHKKVSTLIFGFFWEPYIYPKGPGNTFDVNPKWQTTVPSFGNFAWDMFRVSPNPNIKVDI